MIILKLIGLMILLFLNIDNKNIYGLITVLILLGLELFTVFVNNNQKNQKLFYQKVVNMSAFAGITAMCAFFASVIFTPIETKKDTFTPKNYQSTSTSTNEDLVRKILENTSPSVSAQSINSELNSLTIAEPTIIEIPVVVPRYITQTRVVTKYINSPVKEQINPTPAQTPIPTTSLKPDLIVAPVDPIVTIKPEPKLIPTPTPKPEPIAIEPIILPIPTVVKEPVIKTEPVLIPKPEVTTPQTNIIIN
jgi:hypothetical protein